MKYTTIPALFVTFSLFFFSISTVHAATLLDVDFENRSVGSYAENDIRTDFQVNMNGYNDPNWLVEFMDIAADPASSGRGNVLRTCPISLHPSHLI